MEPSTMNMTMPALAAEPLALTPTSATEIAVPAEAQPLLLRMFATPRQMEPGERTGLIAHLRHCVAARPGEAAPRILLGMALCVNLEVPEAVETLREAVKLEPDNFMARLKFGELWMRLRVLDQAADHTAQAERLAVNYVQIELARRQSASIREMRRNGIERGGYKLPFSGVSRGVVRGVGRLVRRRRESEALALPNES